MNVTKTTASVTLNGVPESISEEQYLGLFEALNIDPKSVFSLEVHWNGISARLAARNASGRMIVDSKTNDVHEHNIFIRVDGRKDAA